MELDYLTSEFCGMVTIDIRNKGYNRGNYSTDLNKGKQLGSKQDWIFQTNENLLITIKNLYISLWKKWYKN